MDIDKDGLAEGYRMKSEEELLDLHAAGTLTDMAYGVLESELAERGVAIPNRPEPPSVARQWPHSLRAHWEGKASLASAFWLVGVLGGAVLRVLFHVLGSSELVFSRVAIWLPYTVFALVSIWRCAWNSKWEGWGQLARVIVVVNWGWLLITLISIVDA